MARHPKIRITEADRDEFRRLARNTKAKIARASKKYGVDISGAVDVPKSIHDFKTREEFNQWKHEVKVFTNRANRNFQFVKNEFGVVASRKEIAEAERLVRMAQEKAKQELKEIEKKPEVQQRMLQMAKPEELTGISKPKDLDFKGLKTRKDFELLVERMERRLEPDYYDKKKELLKNNFILALERNFHSDADELVELIEGIPAEDFYELYLQMASSGDNIDISYPYTTTKRNDAIDTSEAVENIRLYVEKYYDGEINMDMKGF